MYIPREHQSLFSCPIFLYAYRPCYFHSISSRSSITEFWNQLFSLKSEVRCYQYGERQQSPLLFHSRLVPLYLPLSVMDQALSSNCVISWLPPAVLKNNGITFSPMDNEMMEQKLKQLQKNVFCNFFFKMQSCLPGPIAVLTYLYRF